MALYLGIDGGGTGCRAAVADASGRILGRGHGGPANIASDPDGARDSILASVADAMAQANALSEIPNLTAVLGLAGANVPSAAARLKAALPFARVRVESDAVVAAKGALHDADGVVAAIGTGSVFAVQRGGRLRQIGGRGLNLGDEGSGAWLGRALLARALRAADGYFAATPLLQAVTDELGGPSGVVAFGVSARPADFARFAPRIAGSQDPAAISLMQDAESEIARAIALLQSDAAVPVVFLGGLGQIFAARLAARWEIRPPLGNGVDGALWLARNGG